MAEYTYEQLKDMTVAQLREIAKEFQPQIEGYTTMHKDHLLPAMCKSLGIHIHHSAQGTEKARLKALVHKLRAKRDEAWTKKDLKTQAMMRQQIHSIKRTLRRMAEMA